MGIGVAVAATVGLLAAVDPAGAHTPHDVIVDVAVSPTFASDSTVLTISDNRVLRSTDGGRHFRETLAGLDATVSMARFGFAPSKPRVVYLTSRGAGVYRSDDGGLHWRSTTDSAESRNTADIAVSPRSPDVVVVRGGIFGGLVSDRRRRTLVVVGARHVRHGRARVSCPTGTIASSPATRRGVMFVSDDDGRTFRARPTPAGTAGVTAIAAGTGGAVFAGTKYGAVLVSTDAGDTWTRVGPPARGTTGRRAAALPALRPRPHGLGVDVARRGVPVDRRRPDLDGAAPRPHR